VDNVGTLLAYGLGMAFGWEGDEWIGKGCQDPVSYFLDVMLLTFLSSPWSRPE
jgi:hypothetical protein